MREWMPKQSYGHNPVLRLQFLVRWFLMYVGGPLAIALGVLRWFRWL